MIQFLKKSALFLCFLLLCCIATEVALVYCPNRHAAKLKYMEDHLDDINTLFLGNSHIENGIDPRYYADDSVYNFSLCGRKNYYDRALAERFIPKMGNLKTVFMPIGYNKEYDAFLPDEPIDSEKRSAIDYNYFLREQTMYCKYMGLVYGEKKFCGLGHYSEILIGNSGIPERLTASLKARITGEADEYENVAESKGYYPLEAERRSPNWTKQKMPHPTDSLTDYHKRKWEIVFGNYKKIAELCQMKNARFILVTAPYYASAREIMSGQDLKSLQNFVDALQKEHDNVYYINLMDDPRFIEEDFFDCQHMTTTGAKKLTMTLKSFAEGISSPKEATTGSAGENAE